MPRKTTSNVPFAFPHHIGPGVRDLTSVLVYRGQLLVTLPGWLAEGTLDCFYTVGGFAASHQHVLSPIFDFAKHYFELAQKQALTAIHDFEPLGSRVQRVLAVYPGDSAAYSKWDPLLDRCLPIAVSLLNEPLHCCTASVEFIWRVWETSLQMGADPDDPQSIRPAEVLRILEMRANKLGGHPMLLIAESGLNRYCMPKSGAGSYATASPSAIAMLATIGAEVEQDVGREDLDVRHEALSFFLFDQVSHTFLKPLTPPSIAVIAQLMQEQEEPLDLMRHACEREALSLLSEKVTDRALLKTAISQSVNTMSEEAQAITGLDHKTIKAYLTSLAENPTVWGTVAGLIASAVSMPEIVTASLAITAFSLLGANAARSSRERRDTLRKSPWAFLYYAQRMNDGV